MKFSQGLSSLLAIAGMGDAEEDMDSAQPAVWSAAEDGRDAELKEILTLDSLSYTDLANKNVFHIAAGSPNSGKCLKALGNFQTDSHMTAKDSFGNTPLHYAAKLKRLDQVKPELLTKKNMEMVDKKGVSVFGTALANQPIRELVSTLPPQTMAAFLDYRYAPTGPSSAMRVMDHLSSETLTACKPFAAKELLPDLESAISSKAAPSIS